MLRPIAHRRRVPTWTALALLAALAGPARGDDLSREMSAIAAQVRLLLDQRGLDSVAVGEFRGPARLASSSGPGLCKALADSLQAAGVAVKRRADLEINGEYRDVEDRLLKQVAVEIKAHIVDRAGAEVVAFEPRGIFSLAAVATLTGATVALPPGAPDERRGKAFADGLGTPKVHIDGARASAAATSPYAIEVLVKADGGGFAPRVPVRDGDGFAFAKIARGEAYAVRLINDSPYDAAVTLAVDGLSVFAFSENKAYTHWIVPARGTLTVPGWHRSNTLADSFLVTDYAKSAAAEALPRSSGVGTITATFAAAWPKGGSPPPDEPSFRKGARSADATGKGPPVKTGFVDVVRDTGVVRAAVSVRYTKDDEPGGGPPAGKR